MKNTRNKRTMGIFSVAMVMMMGLAGCGDSTTPASPTAQVKATSTAVSEQPTVPPTEGADDGWQTFSSQDGGFSVDMPGEPQETQQTADTALGEITVYFVQVSDGAVAYGVVYNDDPVDAADLDPDQVLEDAINEAAQGETVQNMQKVEVQGYPAIEGEVTIQEVAHAWVRVVLAGKRVYQLIITAPEASNADYADGARRFIESFSLVGR